MKKRWSALALGLAAVGAGLYEGYRPPALPPPLTIHSGSKVWRLALSPDGRLLADAPLRGQVLLYDAVTGVQKCALGVRTSQMIFSPDGSRLLTLSLRPSLTNPNRAVQVWDTATGAQISRFVPPGQTLGTGWGVVTLSPDLRWVVVQGGQRCTVYDIAAGGVVKALPLTAPSSEAAFSPNNGLLAISGGTAGGLQVWDTKTWHLVHSVGNQAPGVSGIRFSPDGARLVLCDKVGLAWWDTRTWKPEGRFPMPSPSGLSRDCYYFASDGRSLLVSRGSPASVLHQVDCATGRETLTVPRQMLQQMSLTGNRGESRILPGGWQFLPLFPYRDTYCIWNTGQKRILYQIAIPPPANSPPLGDFQVHATDLSADGHVFAVGGFDDGMIRVWQLP